MQISNYGPGPARAGWGARLVMASVVLITAEAAVPVGAALVHAGWAPMKRPIRPSATIVLCRIVIASCPGLFPDRALREIRCVPPLEGAPSALPCTCRASYGPWACALGLPTPGEALR
jgi:hypothetical protein